LASPGLMGDAVLSLATDPIFLVDAETLKLSLANRAFSRVLGHSSAEASGLDLQAVLASETTEIQTLAARLAREGQAMLGVRPFRHKDGRVVDLETRAGSTGGEGSASFCFVARELSELQRAEAAARADNDRCRILAEATFEAIAITEGGRIVYGNDNLAVLLGAPLAELIGRSVLDFVPPEYQREMVERLRRGVLEPYDHELMRVDRTRRPVEALVKSVQVGGRTLRVTSLRDIAQRKRLEEEVRRAMRMEAIGRLAGGVAHDFNNLLTVIMSVVKVMSEAQPSASDQADLRQIELAAERAAELTSHLLSFARKQITEPAVIDVNALLAAVDPLLRRLLGEHITLKTVYGGALGAVRVDPAQLEQVVMNLAINARDAMESGGTLTLETANVELGADYAVTHPEVEPGEYVMIGVSDTGHGMDAATLARVFEPFFTTKVQGRGSGLGLATSYGIVRQCGGSIGAYSEPDHGTTFKVYLPRVQAALTVRETKPLRVSATGSETLLLVEDEELVRRIASRILVGNGYRVHVAVDGADALQRFEELAGKIDALVTDVVLPKVSAKELVRRLKLQKPDLRVLYTSGYTENTVVHQGVVDAGVSFLAKPYLPADLSRAVREVLDKP
jgi:two-component system, cell cycle sensor histidine kinase and response regulator CckA